YECTYGTYVRMEYQKTFDAILATPILFEEVIMGELLWGTTKSLIYGTIILIVMLFFGLVNNFEVLFLFFYLIFCGLIFSSLSLIATALVPGIESFNYFYTLFLTPLFLFSGIFFPLEEMPSLLKGVSQFNPLFHLVSISRTLFYVGINEFVLTETLYLLIFLFLLMPLPFLLLKRRYLL
ncbi:MAG: ABC transporter permease, partial [Dictyoglomus sp.]